MAKMTKKNLIELIREAVEEHMAEDCASPMPGDDMAMSPESDPMMDMGQDPESSKMDQMLDMMQQILMKLDGQPSMEEPMGETPPVEMEMRESKNQKK